ncbi:hypothetical protein HFP89_04315 [Wenzhouxiangella sp. XN79A]|uniref:hypothetical protein n=1 Tax=Wenzhouxiangella sp. XN79A TaxID=2724193 RepID=UPI00144A8D18|nr:hypothetical protein [Wenzhouxiangella sp. XN79A]NKI34384.1 hypothetical protein [Wenzhouxiangella sp. XN79A]
MNSDDALVRRMAEDLAEPPPPGLEPLIDALRVRFGDALRAVVLYGSCRRNAEVGEGLVDLMAVVGSYRAAHGRGPIGQLTSLFNALLPPNVYYLEAGPAERRVRCKFIVVSEATLLRRTGGGLDAYFWARFTQPCRLVHRADDAAASTIAACRAAAARTFADQARTLGDGTLSARSFWIRAVQATYGCELRPEPPGSAAVLVDRDPAFWQTISAIVLPARPGIAAAGGDDYRIATHRRQQALGRLRWTLRRGWGKTLNVLRLLKAAGTFTNGIDYLVWKIERHSGIQVEPTERMRRWPRLSGLVLLVRLWKRGAFR